MCYWAYSYLFGKLSSCLWHTDVETIPANSDLRSNIKFHRGCVHGVVTVALYTCQLKSAQLNFNVTYLQLEELNCYLYTEQYNNVNN